MNRLGSPLKVSFRDLTFLDTEDEPVVQFQGFLTSPITEFVLELDEGGYVKSFVSIDFKDENIILMSYKMGLNVWEPIYFQIYDFVRIATDFIMVGWFRPDASDDTQMGLDNFGNLWLI